MEGVGGESANSRLPDFYGELQQPIATLQFHRRFEQAPSSVCLGHGPATPHPTLNMPFTTETLVKVVKNTLWMPQTKNYDSECSYRLLTHVQWELK